MSAIDELIPRLHRVRRALQRREEIKPFKPSFGGPYKIKIAAYDVSEFDERVVEDDDLEKAMWKGQNALWAEFGNNKIDNYTYPIETVEKGTSARSRHQPMLWVPRDPEGNVGSGELQPLKVLHHLLGIRP